MDDNHCQNEGTCGATIAGICDCKASFDFKPDCSGKLDDEKYLYDCIKIITCISFKKEWICTGDISCSNQGTCGAITQGVCDCKPGFGSTHNCSGESLHLLNDKK